jgi:hypothetical protein
MRVTHLKPRKVGFHANYKISLTKKIKVIIIILKIHPLPVIAAGQHLVNTCCKTVRMLAVSYGSAGEIFTQQNTSQVLVCFSRKSRRKLYICASPKKMSWQDTISVLPKLEVLIPALNEYKNCPFSGCRNQN